MSQTFFKDERIENSPINFLNDQAYLDPHHIPEFLKKGLTEDVIGQERDNLLTEIKCFEFFFQNGELHPMLESVDKDGNKWCYPEISKFTESEINYLKKRLSSKLHPYPKSRYAHILWLITKHNDFGNIAVNAYKELTSIYFEKSVEGFQLFHEFCQVLHCYHRVSVAIKYDLDECKKELVNWLQNDKLPTTWKDNILDIILDSPLYKHADFQGLTSLMISYITNIDENYFVRERYLKSCLLLAQKEGILNNDIFNHLGENELALANKREDDQSGMILIACYQKAAYYYRMAGNAEMCNKVSSLYTQQKAKLKLNLFQYEFPPEHVKLLNDEHNAIVDKMLSKTEPSPLWYLVLNKGLLTNEKSLEEGARENMKNSFMYFANMQVYDLNNNAKTLKDEDDKLAHQKSQNYSFHLQLSTMPIIEKFLYKGVRTGKLNRDSIMNFFSQTWLSKPLEVFTAGETPETFSWFQLLGPGLFDVVSQLEAQILDKKFNPNFILSIDSLSIKIEGIIRDLLRLSGISVSKIKEGETLELNLEELLREEAVTEIFTEEDILLWKFLLTKNGWNLRNNVAHSFYRPNDYNRSKAILLLLSVFRLCKYNDVGRSSL